MANTHKKSGKKVRKANFEEKLEQLVLEYREAKEILDSLTEDSDEYLSQQKKCDKLFANTERFISKL